MTGLEKIEGIGEVYGNKLGEAGIHSIEALLEAGKSKKGRQELADKTGISEKLILEWVNLADLYRIKGIGEEYSDLLEEAGVDSVPELAQRNPENLHSKLVEINNAKSLVRQLPSPDTVKDWIEQAKDLDRIVTH
jgi:predicted flap endonuclease-1-like 5' DNA nuclease